MSGSTAPTGPAGPTPAEESLRRSVAVRKIDERQLRPEAYRRRRGGYLDRRRIPAADP